MQSLSLDTLRSIVNVKISLRIECGVERGFESTHDLAEKLSLRCSRHLRVKQCRNFIVLRTDTFSFIIFPRHKGEKRRDLHINATGIRNLIYIPEAKEKIVGILLQSGVEISRVHEPLIENLSSSFNLHRPINLLHVVDKINHFPSFVSKHDWDRFPGLTISHREHGSAVLFSTGRLLLWGQKSIEHQQKLFGQLQHIL